ncbi:glycosyltransferase family 2 protein [Bradyrhizobium sp. 33ap4]|uniref:glycosyltransferase family 2 protein n=1 Tax=Bradyrhizobium sp. 33ap4 TaxID=3061630 RepID=UPI00292DA258|nr:glycosyltransferase [Bradyrhizobium sp. 33ap4]
MKRLVRRLERLRDESYFRWTQEFDSLSDRDRLAIIHHIQNLDYGPLISVVMPAYEPPSWAFREAIDSVRAQLYPNWELCVADDASPSPHVTEILRSVAAEDQRIKWLRRDVNGNISAASNSALALASGEYVALMDHDDVLPPHALYEIVVALNANSDLDIIYSDEDQIDKIGRRHSPYFKTDWNADLMLGHNLVSHLGVYRRSLVQSVGGFREGLEGSQDYDLALRCADATLPHRIHHVPAVLYHWRRDYGTASYSEENLDVCSDSALRAIREHLERRGDQGDVLPHPERLGATRVLRRVPSPAPLVSLIVPTKDQPGLLENCVDGILNRTDYSNTEVLIINHESELPETIALLTRLKSYSRVRVIDYVGEFNYSAINNMAAAQCRGSILGLINNDIEVISPEWLSEMVSLAVLPEVGAVGAKLLYPDNRVQHGGLILGFGGVANPLGRLLPRSAGGYFGRNQLTSSVSAVTGACLVIRKSVYDEVDGLDAANLPVAFNDVDFCLRVIERSYRNIWTPHAQLYHHESVSRGFDNTPEKADRLRKEIDYMVRRWGPQLASDPFYNQNLSLEVEKGLELAFPPRRVKPWVTI